MRYLLSVAILLLAQGVWGWSTDENKVLHNEAARKFQTSFIDIDAFRKNTEFEEKDQDFIVENCTYQINLFKDYNVSVLEKGCVERYEDDLEELFKSPFMRGYSTLNHDQLRAINLIIESQKERKVHYIRNRCFIEDKNNERIFNIKCLESQKEVSKRRVYRHFLRTLRRSALIKAEQYREFLSGEVYKELLEVCGLEKIEVSIEKGLLLRRKCVNEFLPTRLEKYSFWYEAAKKEFEILSEEGKGKYKLHNGHYIRRIQKVCLPLHSIGVQRAGYVHRNFEKLKEDSACAKNVISDLHLKVMAKDLRDSYREKAKGKMDYEFSRKDREEHAYSYQKSFSSWSAYKNYVLWRCNDQEKVTFFSARDFKILANRGNRKASRPDRECRQMVDQESVGELIYSEKGL